MPKRRRYPTTRKGGRTRKHSMRRKASYRMKRRKVMRRPGGRLRRIVQVKRYHAPIARNLDRDHFILQQQFEGIFNWTPIQVVPNSSPGGGDHTSGFKIAMNSLCNTFGIGGGISSTNWGLPQSAMAGPSRGLYVSLQGGMSGNIGGSTYSPDGLTTIFGRFRRLLVTHGVLTLSVSNDTTSVGSPARVGSLNFGVCGFPPRQLMTTSSGVLSDGYYTYPTLTSIATGARDEGSWAGFKTEANAKVRQVSGYGYAGKTPQVIKYPFSLKKYMPPAWYASGGDLAYQQSAQVSGNPDVNEYQPYLLCQFHSTGASTPETLRIGLHMKWYVTAFDRVVPLAVP